MAKNCMQEPALQSLLSTSELEEVFIRQSDIDLSAYWLSVKIFGLNDEVYLAPQRVPNEPRAFKSIETAISIGSRFFRDGQQQRFVVIRTPPSKMSFHAIE